MKKIKRKAKAMQMKTHSRAAKALMNKMKALESLKKASIGEEKAVEVWTGVKISLLI
jgi:hypothetical protein